MSTRLFRFAVIALTALAVLAPLSLVFYQSFLDQPFFQPGAKLGLDAYEFVLSEEDFWTAFFTTIAIAAGMTVIAVPLGAVLAFLMVRTDVPGKRYLEPLLLIPIFVSAVVIAFGYVVAVGPVDRGDERRRPSQPDQRERALEHVLGAKEAALHGARDE